MKKLLFVLISVLMVLSLTACGEAPAKGDDETQNVIESKETEQETAEDDGSAVDAIEDAVEDAVFGSYEDILEEYSQKLRDATPILIEEYKKEAANNDKGLEGLAELSVNKMSELAKISNDGVQEMAKIYMKKGSGEYSEYEEWAGKLMAVYSEESTKIHDTYMEYVLD